MTYRLHFDRDPAPDNFPSVDELSGGTPLSAFGPGEFTTPPARGFVVTQAPRRLTAPEWFRVQILRQPDPRIDVYPVEINQPPKSVGPGAHVYTVDLVRPEARRHLD